MAFDRQHHGTTTNATIGVVGGVFTFDVPASALTPGNELAFDIVFTVRPSLGGGFDDTNSFYSVERATSGGFTVVPAPGAVCALAIGALAMPRRRRGA